MYYLFMEGYKTESIRSLLFRPRNDQTFYVLNIKFKGYIFIEYDIN
jgi:hypothetical protein